MTEPTTLFIILLAFTTAITLGLIYRNTKSDPHPLSTDTPLLQQQTSLSEFEGLLATVKDQAESKIFLDIVRDLEPAMRQALDELNDIDHDLLVMGYGFRAEGFTYRASQEEIMSQLNVASLERARLNFAQSLSRLLRESGQALDESVMDLLKAL